MTNPITGSHRKLVVQGGVIVAAALVGDLSRVGLITQLYDRRTVLGPHEPGQLLAPESATTEAVELTDEAEVCACAGVSAGAVRACSDLAEVRRDHPGHHRLRRLRRRRARPAGRRAGVRVSARFHRCYMAKRPVNTRQVYFKQHPGRDPR